MIIKLYRILLGYLRVRFYGDLKERVLSLCAGNGISLWRTKLTPEGIESNITVKDFKLLRLLIRGKGVKVHILKRRGIPFVVNRYRYRYGILAGVILFFVFMGFMSRYIWIIDIKGNNSISDKEIISACESIGIIEGIEKDSIYPKAEREKLMLKLEGIAWASLNIEGSRLTVNVTETKEKDEEKFIFSNLKSSSDAIIEKIDIVSGTSVVNVGQAVKKGDLLVSGIIETADGTRFVKSKGTVTAKSQNEINLSEDFEQRLFIPTGKVKTKRVIEFFGISMPLYLGEENGDFDINTNTSTVQLFSSNLPIKIHRKKFTFKKQEKINYSYEQLCEKLEKRLEKEMENENNIKILNKEFTSDEKGVTLTALIEREENIALSDILLINTGN